MNLQPFTMPLLNGKQQALADYEGHVLLIVNTASRVRIYSAIQRSGATLSTVQGRWFCNSRFSCNQFKRQEPGSNDDIASFCEKNYGVSFPMFSKIDVNGDNAAPLYKALKQEAPGLLGSRAINGISPNSCWGVMAKLSTVTAPPPDLKP